MREVKTILSTPQNRSQTKAKARRVYMRVPLLAQSWSPSRWCLGTQVMVFRRKIKRSSSATSISLMTRRSRTSRESGSALAYAAKLSTQMEARSVLKARWEKALTSSSVCRPSARSTKNRLIMRGVSNRSLAQSVFSTLTRAEASPCSQN